MNVPTPAIVPQWPVSLKENPGRSKSAHRSILHWPEAERTAICRPVRNVWSWYDTAPAFGVLYSLAVFVNTELLLEAT